MESFFLSAIGFYLLLFLTRYILLFNYFRKLRIQYPQYDLQPVDAAPAYLKSVFQQPVADLKQLGFKFCSFLLVTPMVRLDFPGDWEILLYHPTHKTYASVGIRQGIEPTNLFQITFYTFFKDRTLLLTLNGISYGLLGELPNSVIEDPYTAETLIHWQAHEARLLQLATTKTPVGVAPAVFLQALQVHIKVYIDHQAKVGNISQVQEESVFRRNTWTLLRAMPQIVKGVNKEAAIAKQRLQLAKTNPSMQVEIPIELEVRQFQRMEQLRKGNGKSKLSPWIVLISFAVFVASYTSLMSPERLAIFVGALLLHEGGHILAMRICGYRDTSMLFLPFLGALATARHDHATVSQKFWVSFAGPIPGLVLGIGLAIFTRGGDYPEWVVEASWMLIGLNLFNLLPVYPLDGGQIADLLVFSRIPLLGLGFKAIGVLVLILLGLGSPMFLGFALLVGLTIPTSFRSDRMTAKLRKELSQLRSTDVTDLLTLIFTKLKQVGFGTLPFAQKFTLVKTLVQRRAESRAQWTTLLSLSMLYCFSLVGGVVGVLEAVLPNWHTIIPATFEDPISRAQQKIEKTTAEINANPKDVKAYQKRARLYMLTKNYKAAIADANQIIQLEPNSPKGYFARSHARRQSGDDAGAEADSQKGTTLSQARALEEANKQVRENPNDGAGYLSRAQVFAAQKEYKGALANYNQVLQLDPGHAEAYLGRGKVWQQLKNYKQAIADVDQVIRLKPNWFMAYKFRGELRRQLGDQAGAAADDRKAEELLEQIESGSLSVKE